MRELHFIEIKHWHSDALQQKVCKMTSTNFICIFCGAIFFFSQDDTSLLFCKISHKDRLHVFWVIFRRSPGKINMMRKIHIKSKEKSEGIFEIFWRAHFFISDHRWRSPCNYFLQVSLQTFQTWYELTLFH